MSFTHPRKSRTSNEIPRTSARREFTKNAVKDVPQDMWDLLLIAFLQKEFKLAVKPQTIQRYFFYC